LDGGPACGTQAGGTQARPPSGSGAACAATAPATADRNATAARTGGPAFATSRRATRARSGRVASGRVVRAAACNEGRSGKQRWSGEAGKQEFHGVNQRVKD